MFGFLDVLDLSAVPLYGDDRSITSSASNFDCPRTAAFAQNKSNKQKEDSFFWEAESSFCEKTLSFFKKGLAICSKL